MRKMRNAYEILKGKPEGKSPLRRPRHRWEDNIRINLREMLRKYSLDVYDSGMGQVVGSHEESNELLHSIIGRLDS